LRGNGPVAEKPAARFEKVSGHSRLSASIQKTLFTSDPVFVKNSARARGGPGFVSIGGVVRVSSGAIWPCAARQADNQGLHAIVAIEARNSVAVAVRIAGLRRFAVIRFECIEEERIARCKVADSEFDAVKHEFLLTRGHRGVIREPCSAGRTTPTTMNQKGAGTSK
jgi:hypothetical protein